MYSFFGALLLLVATFGISSHPLQAQSSHPSRLDIVDTAVSAGSFNTLATALEKAGLVHTLKGRGSFTVFAPTDDAFAKLPEGTLESLLKPENKDQLIQILTYHVSKGRVKAQEVAELRSVETVNGQRVDISIDKGRINLENASVIQADIRASNGVIHVIDEVLLPETRSIPEVADDAQSFSVLLAAVEKAGLVDALVGPGPFTVFAPTDDAFANLPDGTVETLLQPENRSELQRILSYHVVKGRLYSDDFLRNRNFRTLADESLRLSLKEGTLRANDATAITTDIDASNGVIHVIDEVLLPSQASTASASATRIMRLAIEKGVPLFNDGNQAACAAIYQVAAESVLAMGEVPEDAKAPLRTALKRVRTTHDPVRQAWMLREGLDRSMESL